MIYARKILELLENRAFESISFFEGSYESVIYDGDNAIVVMDNGEKLTTKLLIAADGKNSSLYNLLEKKKSSYDYKQLAITGTIEHNNHHNFIAIERFLSNGPFAMLPLYGGYHSSIIWADSKKNIEYFFSLSQTQQEQELQYRAGLYFENPKIKETLQSFPLSLNYAKNNVYKNTIFIGDAAHGIHPLAGQGFNLSLRDIKELTQMIEELKFSNMNLGDDAFVKEFYARRKNDVFSLVFATHSLNTIFTNKNPFIKKSRQFALQQANKSSFIKR